MHETVLRGFYALSDAILDGMPEQRGTLVRNAIESGKARLRITVDATEAPYWQAHLIGTDGQRLRLAEGRGKEPEEWRLLEACAPFLEEVLSDPDLSDKARADLIELIARRHCLRIRCDVATRWRILVSAREIGSQVTGETHIATFSMASETSGPQVAETAPLQ